MVHVRSRYHGFEFRVAFPYYRYPPKALPVQVLGRSVYGADYDITITQFEHRLYGCPVLQHAQYEGIALYISTLELLQGWRADTSHSLLKLHLQIFSSGEAARSLMTAVVDGQKNSKQNICCA